MHIRDLEDATAYCDVRFTREELWEMLARCDALATAADVEESPSAPAVLKSR